MRRVLLSASLSAALLSLSGQALAEVQIPHTFVNGEKADASQVNENFSALANAINEKNRLAAETIEDISAYFAPLHIQKAVFEDRYAMTDQNSGYEKWEGARRTETYEVVSKEDNKYLYHTLAYKPDGSLFWDDNGDINLDSRGIWFSYSEYSNNIDDASQGMTKESYEGAVISLPASVSVNQSWSNGQAGTIADKDSGESLGVRLYADQRTLTAIEDVTVTAGSFKQCLRITQLRPQQNRIDVRWLCPQVGLVKQFRYRGSSKRVIELQSYETASN